MNEPLPQPPIEQPVQPPFDSVDVFAFAFPIGLALLAIGAAYFAN